MSEPNPHGLRHLLKMEPSVDRVSIVGKRVEVEVNDTYAYGDREGFARMGASFGYEMRHAGHRAINFFPRKDNTDE